MVVKWYLVKYVEGCKSVDVEVSVLIDCERIEANKDAETKGNIYTLFEREPVLLISYKTTLCHFSQ